MLATNKHMVTNKVNHLTEGADEETSSKKELAADRTSWAYKRTAFARERTFSAWIRTGLAFVASGLAVARLLRMLEPEWMVILLGTLLVCIGGGIFVMSFLRFRRALEDEDRSQRGMPIWLATILMLSLVFASGLALWLLVQD
jgi:putative membrane protein